MPKPSTPESSTTEVVTPRLFLDVATVYDAPEVREVLSDYRRAEMAEMEEILAELKPLIAAESR